MQYILQSILLFFPHCFYFDKFFLVYILILTTSNNLTYFSECNNKGKQFHARFKYIKYIINIINRQQSHITTGTFQSCICYFKNPHYLEFDL